MIFLFSVLFSCWWRGTVISRASVNNKVLPPHEQAKAMAGKGGLWAWVDTHTHTLIYPVVRKGVGWSFIRDVLGTLGVVTAWEAVSWDI